MSKTQDQHDKSDEDDKHGAMDSSVGRAVSIHRCAKNLPIAKLSAESNIALDRLNQIENGMLSMTLIVAA